MIFVSFCMCNFLAHSLVIITDTITYLFFLSRFLPTRFPRRFVDICVFRARVWNWLSSDSSRLQKVMNSWNTRTRTVCAKAIHRGAVCSTASYCREILWALFKHIMCRSPSITFDWQQASRLGPAGCVILLTIPNLPIKARCRSPSRALSQLLLSFFTPFPFSPQSLPSYTSFNPLHLSLFPFSLLSLSPKREEIKQVPPSTTMVETNASGRPLLARLLIC